MRQRRIGHLLSIAATTVLPVSSVVNRFDRGFSVLDDRQACDLYSPWLSDEQLIARATLVRVGIPPAHVVRPRPGPARDRAGDHLAPHVLRRAWLLAASGHGDGVSVRVGERRHDRWIEHARRIRRRKRTGPCRDLSTGPQRQLGFARL